MKWVILLAGIAANASASILIKVAVTPPHGFPSWKAPWSALTNVPLWLGLALYGVSFVLYALALTRLPLNVAQPILTSGAIALVTLCSVLLFKEAFHWSTALGLFFVIVGVVLISAHKP